MSPLVLLTATAALNCWVASAEQYNLPPYLLSSIAMVESGFNPNARNCENSNGTCDIGLMQINSSWLPQLVEQGITESDLYRPCISVQVGAWILAQEVERYGYSWQAIGSYNAGPYTEKSTWKLSIYREYADKVLKRWIQALEGKLPIVPVVEHKKRSRRKKHSDFVGGVALVEVAAGVNQ
jgi:soluble lytic murein transglycosylase-like protein